MRFSWLLVDELAIGSAPNSCQDLDRLEREGVRAVLSLCDASEAPPPHGLTDRFVAFRVVLPDHHRGLNPQPAELENAVAALAILRDFGAVYVHCLAGVERSPLVAMAWLMHRHGLDFMGALDYLQQAHPGSSPLPEQLASLRHTRLGDDLGCSFVSVA